MAEDIPNGSNGKLTLWVKILDRYGFPVFVAIFLMFTINIGTKWIAEKILVPVAEGHLKLINKQADLLDDIQEEIKEDREDGHKREQLLRELHVEQNRTTKEQERTSLLMERLIKAIESRPQM